MRNASSRAESGNVYFDYKYLKTFRNDAQVADTLAHEIAHILMGHLVLNHEEITDLTSEFAPNFKRENYPSDKELREIGKTCYEAQSNNIEEWFFYDYSDKFKGHKAIETLKENEVGFSFNFANHDIENMEPYATIRECNITVDRQKALKELFDLGDEFISADNEDFESWNKAKKAILDLSKREDVVQAIKKAQKLSDQFKEEFESKDYNEMYNWKEEQTDEVGSELLYRAGFDINSYLQFVKNYLALHPEQKTACANIRNEGRKAERGSGTHPSMCYRLQNFEHERMQAHKDKYIDRPNEGKTTVFANSQGPEFDSL